MTITTSTKKVGRPKKEEHNKVSATHTKFTVTLSNTNKEFLLAQKAKGEIKDVSSFLNGLLDVFRTL